MSNDTPLNLPTVDNPLILIYQGQIPAMKNETQVRLRDVLLETSDGIVKKKQIAGVGKPAAIRRWLSVGEHTATEQMKKQGFDKMIMPYRVACWTILGFYKAPTNRSPFFLPKKDADNAFTTVQETWKDTIMDDDRQVVDYHVSTRHFTDLTTMHTVCFVWSLPLEPHDYHPAVDLFINGFPLLGGQPVWELMKRRQK